MSVTVTTAVLLSVLALALMLLLMLLALLMRLLFVDVVVVVRCVSFFCCLPFCFVVDVVGVVIFKPLLSSGVNELDFVPHVAPVLVVDVVALLSTALSLLFSWFPPAQVSGSGIVVNLCLHWTWRRQSRITNASKQQNKGKQHTSEQAKTETQTASQQTTRNKQTNKQNKTMNQSSKQTNK